MNVGRIEKPLIVMLEAFFYFEFGTTTLDLKDAKRNDMKNMLLTGLKEIIPVMIGVYLGFALNNYGETRKLDQEKITYMEMLKTEIQQNLKSLEAASIYHEQITNDFDSIAQSENVKKSFDEYQLRGLRPGFVNRSAYETGIQTGIIQSFDLKIVQILNKLYTLQRKYDKFNENMLSGFLAQKFPETSSEIKNMLKVMNMNMNDVNNFERELIAFYKDILPALE